MDQIYIFFLQGRILGDLSKKICQRSNIISLLKVFSFIHLYDLLGIKAKRAKVNRRVPKLGNITWGISSVIIEQIRAMSIYGQKAIVTLIVGYLPSHIKRALME